MIRSDSHRAESMFRILSRWVKPYPEHRVGLGMVAALPYRGRLSHKQSTGFTQTLPEERNTSPMMEVS